MKETNNEELKKDELLQEFVQVKVEPEEECGIDDVAPSSSPGVTTSQDDKVRTPEKSWQDFVSVKVEHEEEEEIVDVTPDLETFFAANDDEEDETLHDEEDVNGTDADAMNATVFESEIHLETEMCPSTDCYQINSRQKRVYDVGINVNLTDNLPNFTDSRRFDSQKLSFTKSISSVHQEVRQEEKPFKCEMCNKYFTQKSHLTQHNLLHSDDNPFKCDICHKHFVKRSHLARHQVVHTEAKPFTCDTCNKQFTQKSHLSQHQVVHTEARPFTCDVCNKSFNKKSNLSRHQLVH